MIDPIPAIFVKIHYPSGLYRCYHNVMIARDYRSITKFQGFRNSQMRILENAKKTKKPAFWYYDHSGEDDITAFKMSLLNLMIYIDVDKHKQHYDLETFEHENLMDFFRHIEYRTTYEKRKKEA